MTDKDKKIYTEIAVKDLERFNKEMKEFEKKGTFINSDGVCSSTFAPKSKKSPKSKK